MPSPCEVREMRRAEADLVIIQWSLESGLRSKDSWVRSEGDRWKSTHRGNSLAVYPTVCTVLKGLRHEVARVAVMT
jgi:hypothetical protein